MTAVRNRATAPLFAVLLGLTRAAWAGFQSDDIGTSGAQFLKLGAGARAEALGESYVAVADEADAIYWNPAALTRIAKRSAVLAHQAFPGGISYEFAGYGHGIGRWGAIGAGLQYVSHPAIEETDPDGFTIGNTFRPNDLAISLAYGFGIRSPNSGIFQGSNFGLTAKYVQSTITRTVDSYAVDLGFLSDSFSLFGGSFRFAYVVQNLGGQLKFRQASDPMPTNLRLGTAWSSKSWLIALDVNEPLDNQPYVSFGTEYRFLTEESGTFAARAGINSRSYGGAGELSGVYFGLGARWRPFGVDYAVIPMGLLGITHNFSLSFSF